MGPFQNRQAQEIAAIAADGRPLLGVQETRSGLQATPEAVGRRLASLQGRCATRSPRPFHGKSLSGRPIPTGGLFGLQAETVRLNGSLQSVWGAKFN